MNVMCCCVLASITLTPMLFAHAMNACCQAMAVMLPSPWCSSVSLDVNQPLLFSVKAPAFPPHTCCRVALYCGCMARANMGREYLCKSGVQYAKAV